MRAAALAPVAVAALATAAWGAEPGVDCASPGGPAEAAVCGSEALVSMDRETARLAADLPDADGPEAVARHRAWIEARDACAEGPGNPDGCLADAYAWRIHQLREAGAGRDDGSASLGPFAFACDGLATPVSAVFINTAAPMVSLAWGAEHAALPEARSASGARYAADLPGRGPALFWEKGGSATFAPPGAPEMSCTIEK